MKPEDIQKVAVIGAGLMGHGIAQEFAMAGYQVSLNDTSKEILDKAVENVQRTLGMMKQVGLIEETDVTRALSNLSVNTSIIEASKDADLVIEAVYENLELKQRIFKQLDECCQGHTIFASNSSSLMPSYMAKETKRPEKVIGAHYFNPPYLLPLVELVKGEATSEETVQCMFNLYTGMGKKPVVVLKEVPGFIGNRLQAAMMREAVSLVEKGIASPQDVDTVVKNSFGRRLPAAGVFEIFDLAGWDMCLAVGRYLYPSLESSVEPQKIIVDKVEAGDLGVKSGKGFYEYTDESAEALRRRMAQALIKIASWEKNN